MQKILNGGVEVVDLLPGAVLQVFALDANSFGVINPVDTGNGNTFARTDTRASGTAAAGPFTSPVRLQVEAVRRVGMSIVPTNCLYVNPITEAALGTTTGVANAIYELKDGVNEGAKLCWAIPEGEVTPTWCWWAWPKAAYSA